MLLSNRKDTLMPTAKQIAANRLNAQKCCGPRTAAGRVRASQNALKTGLYAKSEVTAFENQTDLDQLKTEFHAHFQPVGPQEHHLVDTLIRSEWLARRYMRVDAAVWDQGFQETGSATQSMGEVFINHQTAFARAGNRLNAAQRTFRETLRDLQRLQTGRATESRQPQTKQAQSLKPELVSFRPTAQTGAETSPQPPRHPPNLQNELSRAA
jgi:hypothetical protein